MNGRRKFLSLSLIAFLSACTASGLESRDTSLVSLTISAAASLQDVIQDLGNLYGQQMPQVKLTFNFGSSGSLRLQIEQGAPVDVYISAAEQHMDSLEQKNLLLSNTRHNLLKNELVLITAQNNTKIDQFSQLPSSAVGKIAIGNPDSVPAGKYAKEVLDSLKLPKSLESKFVFAKDVRQVLAYVETGNVEVGMVYRTDARISKQVKIIETAPINSHAPIVYPTAVIRHSKQIASAKDFIQFLLSNDARNIFADYGFIS
ncbi:MAG: molybdate ABC transporter substrate-binding protein [Cyanobacteria bacterium P01_E01_bin.35]